MAEFVNSLQVGNMVWNPVVTGNPSAVERSRRDNRRAEPVCQIPSAPDVNFLHIVEQDDPLCELPLFE